MTSKAIRDRFHDEYDRATIAIPNRMVESTYVKLAKQGNQQALRTLISKYIPFLFKMARQLKDAAYNLTEDEMVNAAVFGMPKAIASFDASVGASFFTYFAPKAMNEMRKAGFDSLLVHRPENQLKSKCRDKVSVSMINIAKDDDDNLPLIDRMASDDRTDTDSIDSEHKRLANEFMSLLLPSEHDVMSRLFLHDDTDVTLRSIGHDLGLSHERIRQLKLSALKRIHNTDKYHDMMAERAYFHSEAI